ncbi:alpha/beta fold hydrolase [Halogeometricum limi]|uniref:Pimeloyl-ACP methyl ester carboxylesterase n=1 Tax=Halogeometricum limi TaxID=555875 RepID=A0A1I6GLM7_9EURY|nr:alpha/beta hydrolase [Halogeometricum limi]SFR43029.1 Pimeloyl-ACP methyl ester carboxylesterase [Halogeometricum limi]
MPTVRTDDIDTYYERRGDGPAIVFVHASMLDHSLWDAQVEALSDDYTTVVYDVRGHGMTGGSSAARYSVARYADDLRALLTALELDRPVVCGLSMGAMVAQTYAAQYPEDVSGVILAEPFTAPFVGAGDWLLRRVVLNALVLPVRLFGLERVERANVWLTERFAPGSGGDYDNVQRLRDSGPSMATAEFAKVAKSMARFHEESVDLSAIRAPSLVLFGEHGLPAVKAHVARLAASLSDVDVDEVPGAGHACNLDDPEYFTASVRRFLEAVSRPTEDTEVDADPSE